MSTLLALAGFLGVAAYNLDLIGLYSWLATVHLEVDVLDEEGPDFVAESVGIQTSLLARELAVSYH